MRHRSYNCGPPGVGSSARRWAWRCGFRWGVIDMWPLSRTIRKSNRLTKLFDVAKDSIWSTLTADEHPETRAFVSDVETFLNVWGFRGPNEFELRSPTWGTKPDIVMAALSSMRLALDAESPGVGADARPPNVNAQSSRYRPHCPEILTHWDSSRPSNTSRRCSFAPVNEHG